MDIDRYTTLVIALSKPSIDEQDKLSAITSCLRLGIPSANRISLWRFEENKTRIRCLSLNQDGQNLAIDDLSLLKDDIPDYFEDILKQNLLVASDARNHPATQCFNESYFKPNDIYSLLDFTFHHHFNPIGIICCEKTHSPSSWTQDDIDSLKRVAKITSMFYKN
ncbi:hypothetical protein Q4561_04775 [Alteromonas sp. 1_MG-2023]|uniref:hypothetical protein n=1 Tax=Alteromonas sp. 1_MG-2023 TaxID=3062669 RepID=UPI0026E409A5|nr:hypothetical protein [Alteromonas sp. 1_MG-2023]MDO6566361.1 hypothetical protein [Alteromonas sp. 1_MG-2023]